MNNKYQNRLALEKSPYLLQHAHNPVDWFPWGDEAFKKAKEENKPVFLSIGYSTCHWCHVMAHESFEDPGIARLMNDAFISIKVDREERPDIDAQYMAVCQMMTQSGGWPLTIIMTPDRRPFFAGTYFPKSTRFGRTGMSELIPQIRQLWEMRHSDVLEAAGEITKALNNTRAATKGDDPSESVLHSAFSELLNRFDSQFGGFGIAPKFPTAHNLSFLLRYWKGTGNKDALEMVEKTLQYMRRGGIYDHIGYGLHRYSTDREWLVPHFEKMLYDQALAATAFLETYQATGNREYARTAGEILDYCIRDMQSPEGGFYSAEDADSEGEEGKFYIWTYDEIEKILNSNEASIFNRVFNIKQEGNFSGETTEMPQKRNIPHITEPLTKIAGELNTPEAELIENVERLRQKLFTARNKRQRPYRDDKILTDWNGLVITALAQGARVLEDKRYSDAAGKAVDFILNNLTSQGRLLHRYRDKDAAIPAYLDDYAFFVYGLLELYETTFDTVYLKKALELNNQMIKHFEDRQNGGFYFTADDAEVLLTRQKEIYDGAIPSGNSIAMLNLLKLSRITADTNLENKAAATGRAFQENVSRQPSSHSQFLSALDFAFGPSFEIVIAGQNGNNDTAEMIRALNSRFIPNKVVIFRPSENNSPEISDISPYIKDHRSIDNKATVYICENYNCKMPLTDSKAMLKVLEADGKCGYNS